MTEPVRTRAEVIRQLEDLKPDPNHPGNDYMTFYSGARVAAALLAVAECENCAITRGFIGGEGAEGQASAAHICSCCLGTGLDQARLARGLDALEGR